MKANLNSAPRLGAQRRVAAAPMPSAARSVTAALTLAATLTLALAGLAEARHRGGPPPPPIAAEDPCAAMCFEEHRACFDGLRDDAAACATAAGCDAVREQVRAICRADDADEATCDEARDILRDCLEPCHGDSRAEAELCRDTLESCVTDECGLELPDRPRGPRRPGPFNRPDGGPRR